MEHKCKKCLLLEAGEKAAFETVSDYLETVSKDLLVDKAVYNSRLALCKGCDFLISGMCLKCGSYVEIRAALNNKDCPNEDDKLW